MLTRIRLENFKSWRELEIDLANINVLFGPNSSGKSSVLQALLMLKQTVNHFDKSVPMHLGGTERDLFDFGSYRDVVYGHEKGARIGIKLDWRVAEPYVLPWVDSPPDEPAGHGYEVYWISDNDTVKIEKLKYHVHHANSHVWLQLTRYQEEYQTEAYHRRKVASLPSAMLRSCYEINLKDPQGIVWYTTGRGLAFPEMILSCRYLGPLRNPPNRYYTWRGSNPSEIGPRGENTIDILLASQRDNTDLIPKVSEWLVKMGLVDDFGVRLLDAQTYLYTTQVRIGETETTLADVGFGISQVLPIITLLLSAPENSIILLEQPELHLHPSAQVELADLFIHAAQERNLQLIIESHSEHILSRLQRRIAEEDSYEFAAPDTIKLYFCKSESGGATIQPVKVTKYGQITNWPEGFFGNIGAELDKMLDAGLARRQKELESGD